jgi:asparagine synthase (glutamine-hydrolysing)
MCGIGGIAGPAPADPGLLDAMAEAMVKRGPDGQGVWTSEGIGLVSRRLAIIDLHVRSNQPLHFERWHLVFNGEIYNYRELRDELIAAGHMFKTEGDAEVLLHAWAEWGEAALDRLNGMFAFAVWDGVERRLTLARDPFGEKPLYYHDDGSRLVFASDITALLAAPWPPADPDHAALGPYLALATLPDPDRSFFAGIRRLPAAHLLRWQDGDSETRQYWIPARVATPARYEDAVEAFRALLLDSIRLRLRSDVPVGTSLSGGVDSSSIVALSAGLAGDHQRHAFTARFPGFERDEWSYADEVARATGIVHHHAVEPDAAELLADLDLLLTDHQEPVQSSSMYAQWRVMKSAHRAGVTVLLDGQGGDEILGGYEGMSGYALRSAGLSAAARAAVGDRAQVTASLRTLGIDHLPRWVARRDRRARCTPYAARELVEEAARIEPPYEPWFRDEAPLRRQLLLQAFRTTLPGLLRYADRNSMAHSREVRLPFLDRRVVEFALSLPPGFVYAGGYTKRILRDVVRGVVPPRVLGRRDKLGYVTPQREWMNEPRLRSLIIEVLLDPQARARGLYDVTALEADQRNGTWRDTDGIWRALNAELWLRTMATSSHPRVGAAA